MVLLSSAVYSTEVREGTGMVLWEQGCWDSAPGVAPSQQAGCETKEGLAKDEVTN